MCSQCIFVPVRGSANRRFTLLSYFFQWCFYGVNTLATVTNWILSISWLEWEKHRIEWLQGDCQTSAMILWMSSKRNASEIFAILSAILATFIMLTKLHYCPIPSDSEEAVRGQSVLVARQTGLKTYERMAYMHMLKC